MSDAAPVIDRRRGPFCYQTHEALDAIRALFDPGKRATALGIYLVLTEVANRDGGEIARGGFTARRKEIAALAGVSLDTLDRYIGGLVEAGVLEVTKARTGPVNLPNVWVLRDPPDAPPSRTSGVTLEPRDAARVAAPQGHKELEELQELEKKKDPTARIAPDAAIQPPKLTKIDGRDVAFDTLAAACQIREGSPRLREVAVALNGQRGQPETGIRAQFNREVFPEEISTAEGWERELAAEIPRRVLMYRQKMPGATLTPGALAKWWTDLPGMPAARGGEVSADRLVERAHQLRRDEA